MCGRAYPTTVVMASTGKMVEQGVGVVIALVVAGIMAAFVLPVALDELATVDTSSWSDGAASIFGILDLIFVLVVFLVAIGWAVSAYRTNGGS